MWEHEREMDIVEQKITEASYALELEVALFKEENKDLVAKETTSSISSLELSQRKQRMIQRFESCEACAKSGFGRLTRECADVLNFADGQFTDATKYGADTPWGQQLDCLRDVAAKYESGLAEVSDCVSALRGQVHGGPLHKHPRCDHRG